jgi:hypothetical protein
MGKFTQSMQCDKSISGEYIQDEVVIESCKNISRFELNYMMDVHASEVFQLSISNGVLI